MRRARVRILPVGMRDDEPAVSDIVGSLLLVGITVLMAAGLGVLLLSFDGPQPTQHSRLSVTLAPGTGGWGTGDEELRLHHLGGQSLQRGSALVRYTVQGTTTELEGPALGSAFGDGALTIGETWVRPLQVALNQEVAVSVVGTSGQGQLLASTRLVAGQQAGALCFGDTQAPGIQSRVQSPPNVDSQTTTTAPPGTVTVTVTLHDHCAGIDPAATPYLRWCLATICVLPYTNNITAMAAVAGQPDTWSAVIPAQDWATAASGGQSLAYFVGGLRDLNGNAGQSSPSIDLVDLVVTYTAVSSGAIVGGSAQGTMDAIAPAQDWTDSSAVTTLVEGATVGVPGVGGPTKLAGTSLTDNGAAGTPTPSSAIAASDNVRAALDTTNEWIEVSGFDVPGNAQSVTLLAVGYEGRRSATGGNTLTSRIDHKFAGDAAFTLGSNVNENSASDGDRTRNIGGTHTPTDVEGMTVRIFAVSVGNRALELDQVFVRVTYSTPATTYALNAEFSWTSVPAALTGHAVEVRYKVANVGDSFALQAKTTAGTWTACATLTSITFTAVTCPLAANNLLAGTPKVVVRFLDSGHSTQGELQVDYARVATS